MQSDYKDLEKLAKEKEDENWDFRKFLKFHDELSDKGCKTQPDKHYDYR